MLQFFTPAQAAELMLCSERWLRSNAMAGRFPHMIVGKRKLVFSSENIDAIARLCTQGGNEGLGPLDEDADRQLDPGNVFGATERSHNAGRRTAFDEK